MTFDFTGKSVLVTGAAHGFGRSIARNFAKCGAQVTVCDIAAAGLAETAQLVGGRSLVLDVGKRVAVQAALAGQAYDILVNNAGGVLHQTGRPLEEVSQSDWQGIFDVNLSGAFFMAQALAPQMKAQHFGRIINISSGAGLGISLTGIQAYASAKAGQIGLTRQLAHELGPWGITVNSVAPGFVRSNPATERQWDAMGAAGQAALVDDIALRRLGTPDDIAAAVMFFASAQAGWITGQVLSVDGGK